jgi:hypothetical protein
MWTDTQEGRKLVTELTWEIVGEIAPQEREIFSELIDEYYEPPVRKPTARGEGDMPLGFGMNGMVQMATPIVASMVTVFIKSLLEDALKSIQEEGATAIRAKIKSLLNPAANPTPDSKPIEAEAGVESEGGSPVMTVPGEAIAAQANGQAGFSKDQLVKVLNAAKAEALKQGASKEEAVRIANALFVRLATA